MSGDQLMAKLQIYNQTPVRLKCVEFGNMACHKNPSKPGDDESFPPPNQ